ncbi:FadR/GntR family transcriptional regulator [Arsenicitalea aurantiaca]|uniref:FadR/GntR family transcriptional regulator n=1 Tax=Arsenicitalea aurantiaca TaxID=1783274 RepID=UPI0013155114|nr:FCD domain-containing protein [Arsenicitalea aurantiaca]
MAEAATGPVFLPMRKAGLTDRLVTQLLGLVTTGNLGAGDQLPSERKLAETFGVSRPTLREAIRALSVLGVLEIRHGGGVFVSQLSAADLLQPLTFFLTLRSTEVEKLYEARELIEGDIAARAAGRAGPEDVAALTDLIVRQEAAMADPLAYRAVDTEFHERLAVLADNGFLARAAQSLNILGLEFRKTASETPEVIARSITDHRAIVSALAAGDAEAARAAMGLHMRNVLGTTRAQMKATQP